MVIRIVRCVEVGGEYFIFSLRTNPLRIHNFSSWTPGGYTSKSAESVSSTWYRYRISITLLWPLSALCVDVMCIHFIHRVNSCSPSALHISFSFTVTRAESRLSTFMCEERVFCLLDGCVPLTFSSPISYVGKVSIHCWLQSLARLGGFGESISPKINNFF